MKFNEHWHDFHPGMTLDETLRMIGMENEFRGLTIGEKFEFDIAGHTLVFTNSVLQTIR